MKGLLCVGLVLFSACAHHVTVPKTTPDPAIGHEHSAMSLSDRVWLAKGGQDLERIRQLTAAGKAHSR